MRVRGTIVLLLGLLACAPSAAAREIDAGAWQAAGQAVTVRGEKLIVPLPGTITATLETRALRELTLRFAGDCPLSGRLAIDGAFVREFEVGRKGGAAELRSRAATGSHAVRITLEPTSGCDRAVIESSSLREWVPIGTELAAKYMHGDEPYRDLVAAKADSITVGTDTQWNVIEPKRGVFDFTGADDVVDFAVAGGLEARGHPLVWRAFIPGYAKSKRLTAEEMLEIMRVHVQTVVGRYAGVVGEWDVVNEAVSDNGSLRNVFWRKTIGRAYIGYAFHFAHAADPEAELYLNEYGVEEDGRKADGFYRLAAALVRTGVPIDGVGFQYHSSTEGWPDADDAVANMKRFAELGLSIQVTEADVADNTHDVGSAHSRGQQRDAFSAAARACKRVVACEKFTLWGLSDRYSWLGERKQPLPFDDKLKSKPAWAAITDALRPR